MVCDLKSTKYYEKKKNFEVSELKDSFKEVKTSNTANTKNLLCGHHDKTLFNKIENKITFNEKNKDYPEQCFQFAFRSFLFQYIHSMQVRDSEISLRHHLAFDAVYDLNKEKEEAYFLKFKEAYMQSEWEVLNTEIYTILTKIHFISCVSFFPYSYMKYRYGGHIKEKLFMNIFPEDGGTKIVISYFKKDSKHCEIITKKLNYWYKTGTLKR